MAVLTLTEAVYRDKIEGAWVGKAIGVTLGAGVRGSLIPGRLNFFNPVPGQPNASLALDFPLIWLSVLEQQGAKFTSEDLAVAWLEHLDYSQDELGYAMLNLKRGLPPPAAGAHSNPFKHGTLAAMRADFWGLIAPGSPQTAASYAYRDATLDHCEDGEWAAMYLAAVTSAAFFLSDPMILMTIGLAMIPKTCRTARAVKTAFAAAQRGATWLEARESVMNEVGSKNFTDVAQNIGFFTLGLFYGTGDFGTALCAGVNCGYDAEMVGGALGAVYGVLKGASGLPELWKKPMGNILIPGNGLRDTDFPFPIPMEGVVTRTFEIGKRIIEAEIAEVLIGEPKTETPIEAVAPSSLPLTQEAQIPEANREEAKSATKPTSSDVEAVDAELVSSEAVIVSPAPLVSDLALAIADELTPPVADVLPASAPAPDSGSPLSGSVTQDEDETPTIGVLPKMPDMAPLPADAAGKLAQGELVENAIAEERRANADADAMLAKMEAEHYPNAQKAVTGLPFLQPVSDGENAPVLVSTLQPAINIPSTPTPGSALQSDTLDAIAWTDSTLVKPLLVMPIHAQSATEGAFFVTLDTGDHPTIAHDEIKRVVFFATNRGGEAFTGKVVLRAPAGWQVSALTDPNQRLFLAGGGGTWRGEYLIRVPEGQGTIQLANALVLRLTPENGEPTDTEFVLMGASCWWTVGPFANFDGEGFDRTYLPEEKPGLGETYVSRAGVPTMWQKRTYPEVTLDLEPLFGGGSGVAYGQTTFQSPTSRSARIVANVNSGVKVWLNGALILRRFGREAFRPQVGSGNWAADIELQAGANVVIVKWVRSSEPIQFSLNFSDREGRGLPEVGNTEWR